MKQSGFHLTVERDWFWFWFWFYYALWLASVFTLVLVLRQSSENRSNTFKNRHNMFSINTTIRNAKSFHSWVQFIIIRNRGIASLQLSMSLDDSLKYHKVFFSNHSTFKRQALEKKRKIIIQPYYAIDHCVVLSNN